MRNGFELLLSAPCQLFLSAQFNCNFAEIVEIIVPGLASVMALITRRSQVKSWPRYQSFRILTARRAAVRGGIELMGQDSPSCANLSGQKPHAWRVA